MSGQKVSYVRITDREYQKFMNSAREVEQIDGKIQRELRQKEQQLKSQFDSRINSANKRYDKQGKIINRMNSDIKDMERDFHRKFKNQAKRHQRDINNLDKKIDYEVSELHTRLDEQRVEYRSMIQEQSKVLNNRIDSLQKSIEQREQSKHDQALAWIDNANQALELIGTYNHNKFKPNSLDELKSKLQLSRSNIENGIYESSIANSQSIWMDAHKLQAQLEQLENEWTSYLKEAMGANATLIATCDAQTTVKMAFDTEGGETQLDADIDYWSNGELSKIKQKALEQKSRLDNSQELEVDDFSKMLQESATLKEEAIRLTQVAKDAILLSQLRSDMASDIVDSLDDAGFALVEECFASDDQRDAIHLKLKNTSGDEVVTIVSPQDNKSNKLNIHFFDKTSDEDFRQARLSEMIDTLSQNGLDCDQPQCVEGTQNDEHGDERVKDFDKIKKQKRG